ncbi:MAG TPA: glutamine--tRNA ligase/YqeY domain fusion protein [Pseudomonadota bacterium]|nr:glutamine--tRNA ligase/YqeY domain fusion protein [Pseudomonadota bacterium]
MSEPTPPVAKPLPEAAPAPTAGEHFLKEIIKTDLQTGKHQGRVATRFPPEPNGYLHIGHAKSICLNFGLAKEFNGTCNLRFDDTNPETEDVEFVDSISDDIRWLGFEWSAKFFASDYFQQLYDWAVQLVKKGKAYVCSLSPEEMREYRGNYFIKGRESPYRSRSVEENLKLLEGMKNGEFPDGAHTLRAKIDMASQNMNLRDPPMYRIRRDSPHHRTGLKWRIYPTYDYAHGLCDAVERITHSICTLEFESHRPLYDWFLHELEIPTPPQQIEFARLHISYTVLSKRKLLKLVGDKFVRGWDDPRMPTLAGLRRRGYTPAAIRAFCERIGVARRDSVVDVALLEHAIRDDLNASAPRVMGVLNPLRVVITNYPEGQVEQFDCPYFPEAPEKGSRQVPFSRVIYIEQDDFREDPPKKFFRLAPGREIRLRWACIIKCEEVIKDPATGAIVELRCTWDPGSRGGNAPDGRRIQGTSHWVSAEHGVRSEVRLYDRLFTNENPNEVAEGVDWTTLLNPKSEEVISHAIVEPSLASAPAGSRFQFERLGYFCVDTQDSTPQRPVFNRIVSLKDSWAKLEATEPAAKGAPRNKPPAPPKS